MSMGEILRTAREQRAVTTSTAAEATHMKVQILEDLENEDFRGIAAPIYGRGFVKLYAEYLELDAAPLVREFMDLYSGKRAPAVGRRAVESEPVSVPEQEPVPVTRTVRSLGIQKTPPLTRPLVRIIETEPAPEASEAAQAPSPVSVPESDPDLDDDPLTLTPCLTPTTIFPTEESEQQTNESVSDERPTLEECHTEALDPSEKRWVVEPEIPFADPNGEPDLFSRQMPQRQPVNTTPIVPVEIKKRKPMMAKREAGPIFDVGRHLDTSPVSDMPQDDQTTKRQHALLKTFTDSFTRLKTTAFNRGLSDDFLQQYRTTLIVGGVFLLICMLTGVTLLFSMTSKPKMERASQKFHQVAPIPNIYAD